MEKEIKSLLDSCRAWCQAYTKLEDKAAFQQQYVGHYKLLKVCESYLADKKHDHAVDIEALRKAHHRWANTFKNANFLADGQQSKVIQSAYQELGSLSQKMESIDWSTIAISSTEMDKQELKEVQSWKQACKDWLAKNDKHALSKVEVLDLCQAFFTAIKAAKATAPDLVHV